MMYTDATGKRTAKGLRRVFLERDFTAEWLKGKTLPQLVEETLVNEKFADFNCSPSILQNLIHGRSDRYRCLYLPKFHCELNPIEVRDTFGSACRYVATAST